MRHVVPAPGVLGGIHLHGPLTGGETPLTSTTASASRACAQAAAPSWSTHLSVNDDCDAYSR